MTRRNAWRVVAIFVAVAGIWLLVERHKVSVAGSNVANRPAPALHLADDRGGTFDLTNEHGRVVLVTFGYTHCPDVCPTILTDLDAAIEKLGDQASKVQIVFVTIDPQRDSAQLLHDYLGSFAAEGSGPAIGLTDTPQRISAAAQAWGVSFRAAEGGTYFDHTAMVAAVGPNGRLRFRYGFSQLQNASAVAQDLSRLIHGG